MQVNENELLLQKVYQHEKDRPDTVYMVQPLGGDQVKNYTWADTVDEARRMAAYLKSKGYPEGSKIAILSKNTAEMIMSDLAIWMAGYVSVAIYPTLAPDSITYVLEHSEAKMLFVGKLDGWENMKSGVPTGLPCVFHSLAPENNFENWTDIVAKTEPVEGRPTRDMDDLAVIVYTSGSTGNPKGVMHSFRTMSVAVKGITKVIKATKEDRMISYLPLAHVFERYAVEGASFSAGSTVFFAESLDTFNQDMQRARPTIFHSVPRLWLKFQLGVFAKMSEKRLKVLLKVPGLKSVLRKKLLTALGLDACRLAVSGSAPLPPNVITWYRNSLGLELLEGYGMSENFAYSHFSPPGEGCIGYVGSPLEGVEQRISERGEIEIKSPANMVGYYKMEQETKDTFTADGFLLTGDRGELDSKSRLKITGRTKELFKTSKGKYVAPAPIENLVNADSVVELCCVTGANQPSPYVLIMLSEDLLPRVSEGAVQKQVTTAVEEILKAVNSQVDPHERLQFAVIVKDEWSTENSLLTPTLKIKRSVVEERYESQVDGWYQSGQKIIWE
jgi:long-subunit acyl-CoA synthetase (AMP-forming)